MGSVRLIISVSVRRVARQPRPLLPSSPQHQFSFSFSCLISRRNSGETVIKTITFIKELHIYHFFKSSLDRRVLRPHRRRHQGSRRSNAELQYSRETCPEFSNKLRRSNTQIKSTDKTIYLLILIFLFLSFIFDWIFICLI